MSGGGGSRLTYQPALDGLRAAAVIAVLLFHSGFGWAKGGYLGVSVFFTLSGYLITTLLVAEQHAQRRVDLRAFWGRRLRRLMPASLACLLLVAVMDATRLIPHRSATRGDLLGALADVANWRFYVTGQSYGQLFRVPSPVQHFWSLAIEEQFYLLLPIVVWFVLTRLRWSLGRLIALIAALFVATTAAGVLAGRHDADLAYYATFARAPELLAGVLLALLVARRAQARPIDAGARTGAGAAAVGVAVAGSAVRRARWATLLAAAGPIAFVVAAWLCATVAEQDQRLSRGGFAAFSLLSVVIVASLGQAGPLRWLLSRGPLAYIGRLSYGIYLYHWPIFLWLTPARTSLGPWPLLGLQVAVTMAVALVSFYALERPVRIGRVVRGRRAWVVAPIAMVTCAVAIAPLTAAASGSRFTYAPLSAGVAPAQGAGVTVPPATFAPGSTVASSTSTQSVGASAGATTVALPPPSTTIASATTVDQRPVKILVAGDSTAGAMVGPLDAWGSAHAEPPVVPAWTIGCSFVRTGRDKLGPKPRDIESACGAGQRGVLDIAATSAADVVVIFDGPWEVTDRQLPGDIWRVPGDPIYDDQLRQALVNATASFLAHVPKVVWTTSPHIHPAWGANGTDPAWDPARMDRLNAIIREVVAQFPGQVALIDYAAWLDGGPYANDQSFRTDGVHVNDASGRVVADWLAPQVVQLAQAG